MPHGFCADHSPGWTCVVLAKEDTYGVTASIHLPPRVIDRTDWPVPGKCGDLAFTVDDDDGSIEVRVPISDDPGVTRALIRGALRDAGTEPDVAMAQHGLRARTVIVGLGHDLKAALRGAAEILDPQAFEAVVDELLRRPPQGVDAPEPLSASPRRWGAITTEYRGDLFRSRTEAKWAVFLTTMRIDYRYEYEGFDLGGPRYLPDFLLAGLGACWLEIKPLPPTEEECEKARRLAEHTGKDVYLVWGKLQVPRSDPTNDPRVMKWSPTGFSGDSYFWAECTTCETVGLALGTDHPLAGCWCDEPAADPASPRLVAAYTAARQERFGT